MSQITKRAIAEAFVRIMESKPMGKITIGDIAEECGISRMTFYYHFQDIYDLIEWICREDVKKVYGDKSKYESWQAGFLSLCRIIYENRKFVRNVYDSFHRDYLEKYIFEIVYELVLDRVNQLSEGIDISAENRHYVARFYMYAIVGVTADWMKDGFRESPEEMSGRLGAMIEGQVLESIRKLEKHE
ncbi:MAG TPA: TetR/AcrR family transcriptional regulator C-terminal domain-containing protein [Candidatus Avanaerovorax faecigallinarum]|nr:TetR/AcrR family transcriptional regulator C-terminal domain-containing protein [Candidatus Avanaerovorax faecigallinarum]